MTMTSKCQFVNENNFKCDIDYTTTVNDKNLCDYHHKRAIMYTKYWPFEDFPESSIDIHKKYKYVGKHWEKCDSTGRYYIYHYILRNRIEGKAWDEVQKMDYDLEIWPGETDWPYCSKDDNDNFEMFCKEKFQADELV
jgi:hypothetical protein